MLLSYIKDQIANPSPSNLKTLCKEKIEKEEVVTELALNCLKKIEEGRIGFGHRFKKFIAINLSYTAALMTPFAAIFGSFWMFGKKIDPYSFVRLPTNIGAGGVLVADFTLGKFFGIRPITAAAITLFDSYRHGAKTLSRAIEKSYESYEEKMKKLEVQTQELLNRDLQATYIGIANELNQCVPEERKKLENNLTQINACFNQLGISQTEALAITNPITSTLKVLSSK